MEISVTEKTNDISAMVKNNRIKWLTESTLLDHRQKDPNL